jgi:hypothetical protein
VVHKMKSDHRIDELILWGTTEGVICKDRRANSK